MHTLNEMDPLPPPRAPAQLSLRFDFKWVYIWIYDFGKFK